jgi:hypothetical protein
MNLPSYYLTPPNERFDSETIPSFERLFLDQVQNASGRVIDYSLPAPKWQFLNYLADTREVVVHGSGNRNISLFEPRQSNDVKEFGDQRAVYAASDGIWAMYYAVIDRDRYVRSLVNSCIHPVSENGQSDQAERHYFFSINQDALSHKPWRTGTVYLLPRKTFEAEETKSDRKSTQWRSFVSVKPLAQIEVLPSDFPFLDQIRGHNVDEVQRRATENPDGFPWLDD